MPISRPTLTQGQALLDTVIAIGVLMILMHAIFSVSSVIYETMGFSRTRLSARHIASEQMELINNLPYDDIGTTTGIPNGIIEEYKTVNHNGLGYTVHTTVIYIDDDFDDTSPTDLLPTDYKQVHIEVSWEGQYDSNTAPIVITTNIAPKGIETTTGGGTLSVLVFDANADPVFQAEVHIVNTSVSPNIDTTLQTNTEGRIILPGAPECSTCYEITVSKEYYSTERTYSTTEIPYPDKYHVTVTQGDLSEITFVIDYTSTLEVHTTHDSSLSFSSYPGVTFNIKGSKTLGTDLLGDYVYKYDETFTTNGSGDYEIEDLEWDTYTITIPDSEGLSITGTNPLLPISVSPNTTANIDVALSGSTTNDLLLQITEASGSAIASASAILNLTSPPFEATGSSGLEGDPDWGQIFFSNLTNTTYDFTISHASFIESVGEIIVDGHSTDTIILTPNE